MVPLKDIIPEPDYHAIFLCIDVSIPSCCVGASCCSWPDHCLSSNVQWVMTKRRSVGF